MRLKISIIGLLVLCVCLLVAGCANEPVLTPGSTQVVVSQNGLPAPEPVTAFDGSSEYRIGSLDVLAISVFQVLELTNMERRVDASGDITLPLIGSVHAGGKTVAELEREIAAKLQDGYMQSPQVSVFIKEYTSQRVTVEGAVTKPGVLPITGSMSLLQAIASTGGLGPLADSHVVVFRVIKGQKMAAVFDVDKIGHGAAADPPLFGDDIVVVDVSGSKSKLHEFISTAPLSLGLFRLFTL